MSTITRWWWVRHAPVVGHQGRIYGQDDFDCDCSDQETFRFLSRVLPRDAVWVTTHLRRTQRTAAAIAAEMAPAPATPLIETDLAEQHFGAWQGMTNAELKAQRDGAWHRFWLAPAHEAPPGGESFVAVIERVAATVQRLSAAHAGRDIVAVTHGGTIRAAVAIALGLEPERALSIAVDNCALTCLDHIAGSSGSHAPHEADAWCVRLVNVLPKTLL
ncbi:MAG TPA: histidine phosphatase family protein [Kiloniellales bacterium]|jgi:broad specificity phosphatase PhoE